MLNRKLFERFERLVVQERFNMAEPFMDIDVMQAARIFNRKAGPKDSPNLKWARKMRRKFAKRLGGRS